MSEEMQRALTERAGLIEERADAVLAAAVADSAPWIVPLGTEPADSLRAAAWRRAAKVVAAYRDRYYLAIASPLGAHPEDVAQRRDYLRADTALCQLRRVDEQSDRTQTHHEPSRRRSTGTRAM